MGFIEQPLFPKEIFAKAIALALIGLHPCCRGAEEQSLDGPRATLLSTNPPESRPQTPGQAFAVEKVDQVTWLINPNGERFFSFGVCCVNMGASRQDSQTTNLAYAAWKHYSNSNQWAQATLRRLKAWGFGTIGGWSDFEAL